MSDIFNRKIITILELKNMRKERGGTLIYEEPDETKLYQNIFNCCVCFNDFEWDYYENFFYGFVCSVCKDGCVCEECRDEQFNLDDITGNYKIMQDDGTPSKCPICKCKNYREFLTNVVLNNIRRPNRTLILKNPCFKYLLRNSDYNFFYKFSQFNKYILDENIKNWVVDRFYNVLIQLEKNDC